MAERATSASAPRSYTMPLATAGAIGDDAEEADEGGVRSVEMA
ncbi:MAG: hypothetical protein R3F14_40425 [Polyangiaceae bacterium]